MKIGDVCLFFFFIAMILFVLIFIGKKESLEIEKKHHKPSIYNLND